MNAQCDQLNIFEIDHNFVETTDYMHISSFKLRSKSVDSFEIPWWLNLGNLYSNYYTFMYYYFLQVVFNNYL